MAMAKKKQPGIMAMTMAMKSTTRNKKGRP